MRETEVLLEQLDNSRVHRSQLHDAVFCKREYVPGSETKLNLQADTQHLQLECVHPVPTIQDGDSPISTCSRSSLQIGHFRSI